MFIESQTTYNDPRPGKGHPYTCWKYTGNRGEFEDTGGGYYETGPLFTGEYSFNMTDNKTNKKLIWPHSFSQARGERKDFDLEDFR